MNSCTEELHWLIGYKLRKHIGMVLKTRSQAIRTALEKYNLAAASLHPPRPQLSWDVVVEYAFLADFDLLSDTRQDIRERPWAAPAARMLLDEYFKIERAHEEIQRLNIEIRRFITYMQDEEVYLKKKEDLLLEADGALAHQISCLRERLQRCNEQHRHKLHRLASLPGFTGTLQPGISKENGTGSLDHSQEVMGGNMEACEDDCLEGSNRGAEATTCEDSSMDEHTDVHGDVESGGEDDEDDEDDDTMLAEMVHKVLQVVTDV